MKKRFYIAAVLATMLLGASTAFADNNCAQNNNCNSTATTCQAAGCNTGIVGGAEHTYEKAKDGTERIYEKTKDGTVKVYEKTKDGTVNVYQKAADGTVKTYDKAKNWSVDLFEKTKAKIHKATE